MIIMIVVGLVLAILAPIIARFVQLAVSRQREYLADASSVELTRNPYGLQRALAKISSDREVLEVANRATQHLYFVNPIKKWESARGGPDGHPPADHRAHQPAARADRPGAGRRQTLGALQGLTESGASTGRAPRQRWNTDRGYGSIRAVAAATGMGLDAPR